jgi:hypothetical protein
MSRAAFFRARKFFYPTSDVCAGEVKSNRAAAWSTQRTIDADFHRAAAAATLAARLTTAKRNAAPPLHEYIQFVREQHTHTYCGGARAAGQKSSSVRLSFICCATAARCDTSRYECIEQTSCMHFASISIP